MLKKLLFAVAFVVAATAMNAQTVIWEENFESGTTLPAGWVQQTAATDGGWKIGTNTAVSSQSFPIPNNASGNIMASNDDQCNCTKLNDRVIFPAFDLTAYAGSSLYLTYDLFFAKLSYQGITEGLKVQASVDGGTTWTTVKDIKGRVFWVTPSGADVSAYAGMANVLFALNYTDGGGWLYGAAVDNIKLIVPDNTLKASMAGVGISRYLDAIPAYFNYDKYWTNGEMYLTGTVSNPGFVPITSFDLVISNGTNTVTESYTVDMPFDESYDFEIPYTVKAGDNDVSVTVSNINGSVDNDPADNTGSAFVEGVTPVAGRKVIGEEATGTWCQWCPRGAVMMDFMTAEYPEFIGIAVHNGDPMVVGAYDAGMGALIGGYPSGLLDRTYNDVDPTEFENYYIARMALEPKVSINQNVAWDETTRTVTVSSYFKFLEEMNGDFRVAVIFTEDDVTGTTSTYAQKNAYAGGAAGPMGGYENLPATIPASQMVYDHVARALIGGFNGAAGTAPATNPAGTVFSNENTYVVPAAYDITQMHAITVLIDNTSGEVLNAEQTDIPNLFVGTKNPDQLVSVKMFPNPVVDEATIKLNLKESSDVQMRVIDAMGRVVVERNYSSVSGEQQLPFRVGSLATGAYMLSVTAKGQTVTESFVISR